MLLGPLDSRGHNRAWRFSAYEWAHRMAKEASFGPGQVLSTNLTKCCAGCFRRPEWPVASYICHHISVINYPQSGATELDAGKLLRIAESLNGVLNTSAGDKTTNPIHPWVAWVQPARGLVPLYFSTAFLRCTHMKLYNPTYGDAVRSKFIL